MENTVIENKIKLLFEKIVEPEYVMNNYYADGLINKLSKGIDPEISFLEPGPLLSDLIVESLHRTQNAHTSVKVFLTRMLAIAATNEAQFIKISSKVGQDIAKEFKQINSADMGSSLRVAYMEVALALVAHDSGTSWLLEQGLWKEILSLCNEKRTVFVVRQTFKFATNFLWKINDLKDDGNMKLILGFILKPITDFDFINIHSMTSEEENEITKTLQPMVQMLLLILSEGHRIEQTSILIDTIVNEYKLLNHIYIVMDRIRGEELSLLLSKLLFLVIASRLFLVKPVRPGTVYSAEDFIDLSVMYFNMIQIFVARRSVTLVLDFSYFCHMTWNKFCRDKLASPVVDKGKTIELHNQLLLISLTPLLVYAKKGRKNLASCDNDALDEYILKLLNSTCTHTARAAYSVRDLTLQLDTLSVTLHCVKRLTCLKDHLNNGQANLVFQALFFILREYEVESETPEYLEDSQDKVLVMTYVMDTVLTLVKNYDINWQTTLEIICLYSVVYNILRRPNLTCKFVVTAMSVITLTVKKFLPPNLSLLMESQPGSTVHELGKLIYLKMHDLNWEIRDSALELLLTCTEISYIKFPPFQKQIQENNLINVAATIAFNDFEFYVQSSALKCIGAACKVSSLWEQLRSEYPNILDKLVAMLRDNQEGIVRREACSVLCEIYQNTKLTQTFRQTLYEHMVSSALSDFHWEVQLVALKFWKIVIQGLFNDQGMLDGIFPPVTFSRETRKIVTLNETEIQKRLMKILEELSSIGCLTVFVKLLQEDSDVDIMDAALSISMGLYDILKQYRVPELIKPNVKDDTVEDLICPVKEEINGEDSVEKAETNPLSDNVIEGILNSDDINLLANIYERHMCVKNEPDGVIKPKVVLAKAASPYLFINHIKSEDFKAVIEQKRKWKEGIRSVSSLLDDILGIYEGNDEINTMDCY